MGNNVVKYGVIKERIEIYKDFVINLSNYIVDYYIDYESLYEDRDIYNHFDWCFNKVCDEFLLEGIDFKDNEKIRQYFKTFYYTNFYRAQNKPDLDISIEYFVKYWQILFDIEKLKNKNVITMMVELVGAFDKSVNREKNILELI